MRETTTDALITVRNVTKEYGKKDHLFKALDGVDLTVNEGESVAIVGKSGSGKSTLMHVVSGLDRVSAGEIIIDGQELATLKGAKLDQFRAGMIGFVFQSFFVQGNETVSNNVSLPLEIIGVRGKDRSDRIVEALEQVGLADKIKQKAKNLSGGQKQRLAVARAIVGRPRILFADEPTGNLDSATGEQIEKLLFDINKSGTTLIIVTHDSELAARCDRQIRIKDGRIEHAATPLAKSAPQRTATAKKSTSVRAARPQAQSLKTKKPAPKKTTSRKQKGLVQ